MNYEEELKSLAERCDKGEVGVFSFSQIIWYLAQKFSKPSVEACFQDFLNTVKSL